MGPLHRIADGCLRLRFENERVTDGRQHSDAVLPELRAGQAITPRLERGAAIFAATAGRVELDATAYGWNWRDFRWRPSPGASAAAARRCCSTSN